MDKVLLTKWTNIKVKILKIIKIKNKIKNFELQTKETRMKASSLISKSDSSGSSPSVEDDDDASTASTAINTAAASNAQHREKYLISRMDHRRDNIPSSNDGVAGGGIMQHHHYDLIVDDDRKDNELYDNLNASNLTHSDENVNDLDFQMTTNSRPFGLAQDNRFLGKLTLLLYSF